MHATGAGSETFIWTPTIPIAGRYHVYARWRMAANRATDAPYTIHHQYGATEIRVNQEINGGRYNYGDSLLSPQLAPSHQSPRHARLRL